MKEYKIIKQKAKLRNSDGDFEDQLNSYAREGWIVKSSVAINGSSYFKIILERDKNR